MVTATFKAEFEKALREKKSPNDHMQTLMQCLHKHSLCYHIGKTEARFFLTHKANRGGLLLSPHNVHRNGARIHAVGAGRRQLTNALAAELPGEGCVRDAHLQANEKLIARSGGLLAPINGAERYVTLGAGHTAAFCKTAGVHGQTPQVSLQKPGSTQIDYARLCENAEMAAMLGEGWEWDIIPAAIDAAYPKFAQIAQQALNTQNHVSTECSELETCAVLGASADDPGFVELDNWKVLAVDNVTASCVPCAPYALTLLEFAVRFGGGQGSPMINFMDAVAKQFQCNATLGRGFWEVVTNMVNHKNPLEQFPLMRVALLLTNLTGNKVEDIPPL